MADETLIEGVEAPNEAGEGKKKSGGRGSGSKRSTARKPKKGELVETEVMNAFYHAFSFYATFRKSATVFDEKDFKDFAKHYVVLAARIPALKYIVWAFAPLATAGEFLKHFRKVESGAPKPLKNPFKRKKKPQQGPIVDAEVVYDGRAGETHTT